MQFCMFWERIRLEQNNREIPLALYIRLEFNSLFLFLFKLLLLHHQPYPLSMLEGKDGFVLQELSLMVPRVTL